MRVAAWVLASIVACVVVAGAAPHRPQTPVKQTPKRPTISPEDQAELTKLEQQYTQLITKQAHLAAVKVARQIYDLEVKVYGKDSPQARGRELQLAGALQTAGDNAAAKKIYLEHLANEEKDHGADSDQVRWALASVIGVMSMQGSVDDLVPMYQRKMDIAKKNHGENSQDFESELSQYASFLQIHGQYSSSVREHERALKILEGLPKNASSDAQIAGAEMSLAYLYLFLNEITKGQAAFDRAIKLYETAYKDNHTMIAGIMYGASWSFKNAHREDIATAMMKRAQDIYEKEIATLEKDKPDDVQLSQAIGMLAGMYQQSGELAKAEALLLKQHAIEEKKHSYPASELALATLKRAQGKPKEALAILEKAKVEVAKIVPSAANSYDFMIADTLKDLGEFKRAESMMRTYLAAQEKQWGKKHPFYGSSELMLANLFIAEKDVGAAERVYADSLEIAEKELQTTMKIGTEADHGVYFSQHYYVLDGVLNFNYTHAPKNPTVTRLAITTLLRRKGRLLDATAATVATIRAKLSPADKQLMDDLQSARGKLAKLTVSGPKATDDDAVEYAKQIAALEDQIAKLEVLLGQKSAVYRAASQPIDLAAIQKLIPKDTKLVEIVNMQPYDPRPVYYTLANKLPRRYIAYVLGASGDPVLVDLAPAADIDAAVEKFRKAVADPDNDRAVELGHALYSLTIGKMAPALGNASEILIAPDGALNLAPFAALVDDKNQFLVKKYNFTYLTSGRDLLRLKARGKAQGGGVIFANPAFDAGPKQAQPDANGSRGRRSADLASLEWPPLPGTLAEGNAVAGAMKGLALVLGDKATASAVMKLHGPKILHLATHGFFLADEAPPPANDNAPPGAPAAAPAPSGPPGMPSAQSQSYENPLLRSGLAFAGANKLEGPTGDDDGILTALEASGLDLEGTKLVVLSACETGVGKVTNGDGVYGLRRALVIAGAESLVMSLWQVDDAATKELMVGYYKRLVKGEKRSSALRDIQLELLAQDKYKHPYYWASFLPAGDNSPIKE